MSQLKKLYQKYHQLTKTYHLSILTASIVYYIILIIIPLFNLIQEVNLFLNNESVNIRYSFLLGLILLINSLYTISKLFGALYKSTEVMFIKVKKLNGFILKIKSFLLVLSLFILFIIYLIIGIIFKKLFYHSIGIFYNFLVLLYFFIFIIIILSIIFKKTIPVVVPKKIAFYVSCILSIVWYLVITIYQTIINNFNFFFIESIYGNASKLILIIYAIYFCVYIFLISIIWYVNYYNESIKIIKR